MSVSMGEIMLIVGCIGGVVCLILLLSSWKIFDKQQKKLLKYLET